jgi:hypothetical protein
MNAISLSRGSINAGAIFVWENMAFYIKVWNFPYYDIKVHIFMVDPLSSVAIGNVQKTY